MSWDELETRVRQEISKRVEVALCGIGIQPGRNGIRSSTELQGNFFFSKNDLPQRISLLRQHLPAQATKIIDDANDVCRHRFRLLGYSDLDYGADIDWHLDAVHNRRAPLIPWYKIDFLNFDAVGDHKVTWELNRHQHLVTLAKALVLTGEKRYADEIFSQWHSWQRANPYPLGPNWASSLEVAFRSLSWIWVDHLLAGYPETPSEFKDELLHSLALHGRYIEKYLSTYFSPNTHLLGEAVVLFFLGTLYPQIPSASRWKKDGWEIVKQESVRQVRPDGVYFEQTLYYHVYAFDFLLYARELASRNGMEIPTDFDAVLQRMLSFVEVVSQCGPPDGFGDDDGGRLFDSARNRSEHMTDPLALGVAVFGETQSPAAVPLTEEAIWLFGDRAVATVAKSTSSPMRTQAFPDGGVYVFADDRLIPQQLTLDAGPQGTGHCGHGHADALSVRFSSAGRRWLVDAGTCCYISPGDERNIFRGTRAHNTLAVDGVDQAIPDGPFSWSNIPEARVDINVSTPTFALIAASHSGYERFAKPVRHRRFIFHPKGSFWLIRDVASGRGRHLLETSWHFAADVDVRERNGLFVANARENAEHLALLPVQDPQWKNELSSEYVSPAYGEKISAQVLRCSAEIEAPAEHAMLLLNGAARQDGRTSLSRVAGTIDGAPEAAYHHEGSNSSHWMIFGQIGAQQWTFVPWKSDAKFLYFRLQDRRIDALMLCDASFAEIRGQRLFSCRRPLQWLEWARGTDVACSDEAERKSFSGASLDGEIVI